MQAQLKMIEAITVTEADMMTGQGTEMFPSGSVSDTTSLLGGDATSLFPSGSAPASLEGEATGLFPSGSAPVASNAWAGAFKRTHFVKENIQMTNVVQMIAPARAKTKASPVTSLLQCFAQHRRGEDDVFWLKENAEILNVLECTGVEVDGDAFAAHERFYDTLEDRMSFFPQYYRFLLSICLDLEDLGFGAGKGEALCAWVQAQDLIAGELSDLQRAEARRLLSRRGFEPMTHCAGLDDRLHSFMSTPETFALPNRKVAYELTHIVFYLSEYGRDDPRLDDKALQSLRFAGVLAYLDQNADLLSEVCISMRFAGQTPPAEWETYLDKETHGFQIERGAQWSMQDDYHDYLMCNWHQALKGGRALVHEYAPERMAFFRAKAEASPLRAMSECMFHMGGARTANWNAMRGFIHDAVGESGYDILVQAEQSVPDFGAFFETFARPAALGLSA